VENSASPYGLPRRLSKDGHKPGRVKGKARKVKEKVTIPAVKVLSPGFLYDDLMRALGLGLLVLLIVTVLCAAAAFLVWTGRLGARAPREQQIKAERNAQPRRGSRWAAIRTRYE
jgi:hypothetical protein